MLYQVAITPDAKIIVQEFDIKPRKLTDEEFAEYSARSPQDSPRNREYYIVPDKVTFGSFAANQILSPEMAQDSPPPVAVVSRHRARAPLMSFMLHGAKTKLRFRC